MLAKHKPAAILHFASLIEVGESVKDPVSFYENNVIGTCRCVSSSGTLCGRP
ncbi:GDP-mannose 4,6-dehydratase [Rhizobium johnstonii]|uniref:GDP-mannose 4,6-dehydratase n=1 Tax=Rhizobium johnstonii TaxID=3019933 RepID=UPI003F984301